MRIFVLNNSYQNIKTHKIIMVIPIFVRLGYGLLTPTYYSHHCIITR